ICARYKISLIEDCAHTMGAKWDGKMSGSFGDVACFSTQTYKHINSGEGGLLVTPHKDIITRAIIYSGSYMLYEKHYAAPEKEAFNEVKYNIPNYSGRMDNLRAAILLPQLKQLDQRCSDWNARYDSMNSIFKSSKHIKTITRAEKEAFVASSIQFSIPAFSYNDCKKLVANCEAKGVSVKWFGDVEPSSYTSKYDSWHYLDKQPLLSSTERVLATLIDIRIPLTFTISDCNKVANIVVNEIQELVQSPLESR
ncbi:MAG: DegT/DnrJ/EryC1/StrS family aminotransferase, partial [Psychromonas sp.]